MQLPVPSSSGLLPAAAHDAAVSDPAGPEAQVTFDRLYVTRPHRWLVVLLVAYAVAASQFAVRTPAWQAPDEPAHYNYIAQIASGAGLPVLQPGDYDQEQLNVLLEHRFAPTLSTAGLRYENYQPPLYYLLATPVFWLSGGSLVALRLFGVVLGGLTVVLLYATLTVVFPGKTVIPLGAAAFAALLPMHMAMAAAVNNDGLAELLLTGAMLVLLHWLRGRFYAPGDAGAPHGGERRQLLLVGLLLGIGMLTKIYAYLLLPAVLLAVLLARWLHPVVDATGAVRLAPTRRSLSEGCAAVLWVVLPALALAVPWWVRNVLLYGPWDILGLARHDVIVAGQPTTLDWITSNGWVAYSERAFGLTFRSFWGVFGWLGVLMDERIYTALLFFTGVIFAGVLWATVRFISGGPDTDMDVFQLSVLIFFGLVLTLVAISYAGYNLKFVQHQGRYLFWGLLPIGTVVALGWREVLQPLQGAITGFLAAVMTASMMLMGTLVGATNKWTLLTMALIAAVLLCQPLLLSGAGRYPQRGLPGWGKRWLARPAVAATLHAARAAVWALPFILLLLLDLMIPSWYIVPQLGG